MAKRGTAKIKKKWKVLEFTEEYKQKENYQKHIKNLKQKMYRYRKDDDSWLKRISSKNMMQKMLCACQKFYFDTLIYIT